MRPRIVTASVAAAIALLATVAPVPRATATATASGRAAAIFAGEGFDICQAPPTGTLRAWLGSPYRAVNIYFAGVNRHCNTQPELTTQWVTTVRRNGWGIIPTYLGLQAPCESGKKYHFSAASASTDGQAAADDAINELTAIGLGTGTPVYFDMEPFNTGNATCAGAVADFLNAWTRRLHSKGYVSGVYAHPTYGLSVVKSLSTRPDDIWWPRYDGNDSTSEATLSSTDWAGHRIHQYMSNVNETWNGLKLNIDQDAVRADVVPKQTAPIPSGPPFVFAASPPAGATLKERAGPSTDDAIVTADTTATPLDITCQAAGPKDDPTDGSGGTVYGDYVWDLLDDGNYVSDLYTTTSGGVSFTPGIPRCDTTPPTATVDPVPPATLYAHRTFSWTGSDPESGIATFDLRYRTARWSGGFGSWTRVLGLTSRSESLPIAVGYDKCVEVRATDRSGNLGRWSAPQCIARALDDTSLSAGPKWSRTTGRLFYQRTATTTVQTGASLRRTGAELDRVGVVATRCPSCGAVKVYVGSTYLGTVSLVASSKQLHRTTLLPPFTRRNAAVRLVTVSAHRVQIDGLVISRT